MPFDLATAKPVSAKGGFDLATARPVDGGVGDIPSNAPGSLPTTQRDAENAARLRAEGTTPTNNDNHLGKLIGSVEPFVTLGSGLVGQVLGNAAGAVNRAVNGLSVREAKDTAEDVAHQMTYQPRTDSGREGLQTLAKLAAPLEGLQGIVPGDAALLAAAGRSGGGAIRGLASANAAAQGAEDAAMLAGGVKGGLRDLVRDPGKPRPLTGVGAARSPIETQRVVQADQLPVPMGKLMTKGMRSRSKVDLSQEAILAKDPEIGAGLRNRTVEINQAALQNFDAFEGATGAQVSGLVPSGKVVNEYLVKRVNDAKGEIRKAYNDAAASVEGKAPADYAPLQQYIDSYAAERNTGAAPIMNTLEAKLRLLDPEGKGAIPLYEYNKLREMVGRDTNPINAPYKKELQTFIDDAVEANGGPLYRSARRQYENYQNEFKNAGAIDRLMRTKPGTKDRATALEDVVRVSTLDAPSTQAVKQVKTTLTRKQDAEGLQAWREVQGETARQIKEKVTKASALGEDGAREVSPAKLDEVVRNLDADGRLEVIFGKEGAEQWRTLRDTVLDMKTVPAQTVSSSGTAEVLAGLLDTTVSGMTGLPLPVASAVNYGVKHVKKKMKLRKANAALNPDGE